MTLDLKVLRQLRVGVVIVDDDGVIRELNDAAAAMLGGTRGGFLGVSCKGFAMSWPPAPGEQKHVVRAPSGPDEGERWLECLRAPIAEEPGLWLVELIDITAQRAAIEAHRQTERRLSTLVGNLQGVAYRCANDPQWTMEFISEGCVRMTGHRPEDFTSRKVTWASVILPEDRDHVWAEVQIALASRRSFELLYRVRGADERVRWVWEQGTGVFDDKGDLLGLEGFITDVTEVRASEDRYRAMFERNQAVKWIIDPASGEIVDANEAAARFYGYSKQQLKKMKITDINLNPPERVHADMRNAAKETQVYFQFRHKKASGEIVDVEVHSGPIELDGRQLLFSIVHDISEKKRLEEALRHAQKMEALGRLAGGVAHDFNNLMTVIVGATSLVLRDLPDSSPARERIAEIAEAGKRAARLTRQLLAVGRRQLLAPVVLDVNERIEKMAGMLRDAIGERIELVVDARAEPPWIEADPDQLEQVVLNLALNARDAMPAGGTLTMRVSNLEVERRDPAVLDVPPGQYVVLDVADTGVGIDPLRMRHIFEPFYTTKPNHAGSGLGLATVYGIVKQSGGNVAVESAPGRGSTFRVALPAAQPGRHAQPVVDDSARSALLSGDETVLVVDDDELVRRLTAMMLEVQGYRVLVARDGEHALAIAAEHPGPIHLVLTDVMMPTLGGGALVEKLLPIRPDVRVLFVSGYVDEVARPAVGAPATRTAFLQKPVTPEALAQKIRALLDA